MLMAPSGIEVGGQPSNRVFDDVVDFDATSLYPSIILSSNIDADGQIGRLLLRKEDGSLGDTFELIEAWACGDPIEIGREWLGLPGVADLTEAVLDKEPK